MEYTGKAELGTKKKANDKNPRVLGRHTILGILGLQQITHGLNVPELYPLPMTAEEIREVE